MLPAVAPQLQQEGIASGIMRGRLHSFRHYFCSACCVQGVPIQTLMDWLGHRDSKMVKYYYHLDDKQAQKFMQELNLVGTSAAE